MGHIYCNKAAVVSANTTLRATLLATPPRPTRLIFPDFFIACFYGNSLLCELASLIADSRFALIETEKEKQGSRFIFFMVTGMLSVLICCSMSLQTTPPWPRYTHHHVPTSTPSPYSGLRLGQPTGAPGAGKQR